VCEVSVLTRRPEHALRLREEGLRISGKSDLVARIRATSEPRELPPFDLGIFAVKATELDRAAGRLAGLVLRLSGRWPI
jgi:ketopantoate reductase